MLLVVIALLVALVAARHLLAPPAPRAQPVRIRTRQTRSRLDRKR